MTGVLLKIKHFVEVLSFYQKQKKSNLIINNTTFV